MALLSLLSVGVVTSQAEAANGPSRIGAATTAYVDTAGDTWAAARGFTGSRRASTSATTEITGTEDDTLYRHERWGMSAFAQPVSNGDYDVTLKMAEIYFGAAGQRVFDVLAEGTPALTGVDIFAAAGKNAAYDRTIRVRVSDGTLNLGFVHRVDYAKVAGVLISPVTANGPVTPVAPPPPPLAPAPKAPQTSLTGGPAEGSSQTATATAFSFTSDQAGSFHCQLDGSAWAACSSPTTVSTGVGRHSFAVKALGQAGLTDQTPATRRWSVTAPVSSGRPSATNTGVPAGTVLRPHYGDLVITTPGATYDAMDIHGFVTIKAPNVKITRSIVRGGVATGNIGLITNYTRTATNFVLEDSELVPEHPSTWIDGIKGSNFHIRRVNIHSTVDAVKVHGDNVTVESSWLHDLKSFADDPNQGGTATHNDGVQVLGGKNIRIRNNNISGASNAALQITQDYSATTDLEFTGNAVDGGGCTVNFAHKRLASMSGLTVRDNRFGRNTKYRGCAIISTSGTTMTASNNVYDDNGAAVQTRRAG